MRDVIEVKRSGKTPSRLVVGDGLVNSLKSFLPEGKRVIIISDTNVHHLYKDVINRYDYLLVGVGEQKKTLETAQRLYGELLKLGADRNSFIVGFGGGIVTDVAGYVASTYMRGVSFGFVASTLLAQVDASVGGKNGVNFEGFKNMVGTFNQPDFVLCDSSLLSTLPPREFRAGLAEIIKAGLIADSGLFELFESNSADDFRQNPKLLRQAVTRAIRVKANIVDQDECERGERRKLNLGHTFAHAIEKSTRDYLHGEAVAIGTVIIAELSAQMGLISSDDSARVKSVFERMQLPVSTDIEMKVLLTALKQDKKKVANSVSFILMRGFGDCEIRSISFEEIDALDFR